MPTSPTAVVLMVVAMLTLTGCATASETAGPGSQAEDGEAAETAKASPTRDGEAAEAGPGSSSDSEDAQQQGYDEGHGTPAEVPADAQTRRVEGTEFAFRPEELTVEAGRPVAVTLVNAGEVEHEWVLVDDDGSEIAHAHAPPGQDATAVFTLDEAGTYEVRCTVAGHAEQGMVGTVTAR